MVPLPSYVDTSAETPAAPTPLALASWANWLFQASNPPGPLPHCAASACEPRPVNIARLRNAAVVNFMRLVIENSLNGPLADAWQFLGSCLAIAWVLAIAARSYHLSWHFSSE